MKGLQRVIHSRAPLRTNDIGGWTDTWFAREGKVLNLAIAPPVEVEIRVFARQRKKAERVTVLAENYGESFSFDPKNPSLTPHPLLQFAIASMPLPEEVRLDVCLFSPVPAGISTGTSASVCVALLGALALLCSQKMMSWKKIASQAHRVETEKLGQQSGIQDQICAAHGGVSYIDMFRYPRARVRRVVLHEKVWNELDRRLCLIYLGRPHRSSSIHEQVIRMLEKGGVRFKEIERMRILAERARGELEKGDLEAYGEMMILNNECQRALSPGLVSREADAIIQIARRFNSSGWKVNGAGGKGGSLTILASGDDRLRRQMVREIERLGRGIKSLPVSLSPSGLAAWEV